MGSTKGVDYPSALKWVKCNFCCFEYLGCTFYWAEVADTEKKWPLELQTKVHPKVRNHGEGPY